jgi:hypothetical protein
VNRRLLGAAVCAALSLAAGGAAGTLSSDPSFAPGPPLPVGIGLITAGTGDFDGDGSPDIVVVNEGHRNSLRILLDDGTGRFHIAPGSPFKVSGYPSAVAVTDFNRDGKLDVALNGGKVLLGDGAGRLSPVPHQSTLASYPTGAEAADVNGDGKPDLVTAQSQESGGYKLRVLLGDGTGHLSLLPTIPSVTGGGDNFTFKLADFNGDGKIDLAVADAGATISILLGKGDGGFGPPTRLSPGKTPGAFVIGDFNGDAKPDLAVPVDYANTIAVLPGNGSGGFRPAVRSRVADAYGLTVADLSDDGRADLAAVGDDGMQALLGDGAGHFRRAALSPFTADWGADGLLAAGDFDGNGTTDVLALSEEVGPPWNPATPRRNMILFQTPAGPPIAPGRTLPAHADAVFSTRNEIYGLAADGKRAAVCDERGILVWSPGLKPKRFRAGCGEDIALSSDRVAWIAQFGLPNEPEVTLVVFDRRLSDGRREELGQAFNYSNQRDLSGPWVGQLFGGGPVLAFNDWFVDCVFPPPDPDGEEIDYCDDYNPTLRVEGQDVVILTRSSGRVKTGATFYPLRAVGGGRVALEPAGAVVVLAQNGSTVARVPADDANPPRGIALSRTRLAVLRTSTLDLYNPAGGAKTKSLALGRAAGLELAGVNAKVALLRGASQLMLVRLSDGKVISLPLSAAAANGLFDAKLTSAGLFYAYNVRRAGRVVFEPAAKLMGRF